MRLATVMPLTSEQTIGKKVSQPWRTRRLDSRDAIVVVSGHIYRRLTLTNQAVNFFRF